MTQSIQNIENRTNNPPVQNVLPSARRTISPQAVRLPEYYEPDDNASIKERLEKNPAYSMIIKGFFGPFIEHPIASILTWFGCSFVLNKYTDACGGDYDKSLLKKATDFGDRIQNSKFIQSKPVQKILKIFNSASKKSGNFIDKHSVLKAMRDTPTRPELEIVKSEMIPQRQRVVDDFNHITSVLKLGEDGFARLNDLDLNNKDKDLIKSFFKVKKINEIPEELSSSFIQLKRLGKSDDFIAQVISAKDGGVSQTKQEILNKMGNKTADWIKAVREDTIGQYVGEVQEATQKVGKKVKIGLCKYSPFNLNLGPLTLPGERTLSMDYVHNRLRSLDVNPKIGAKTATGRFISKFMQLVHRGLTFGGGKYGVLLFIAPAFVETAINVHKAEPKEKIGTGVSNLTNHISWVFTFPIALQIMHHVCGAQYAGMDPIKQVQKIRKLQNDFNAKNNLNGMKNPDGTLKGFKNYAEWDSARIKVNKAIKELKEVKGQKWYTKLIRKIASIITPDLGKLDGYNPGNFIGRKFYQLRNLPRNLFGVPLRLVLFGLLTMGVLDAAINKTIKLIFGGSYDSMKEEEQKEAKKEQKEFLKEDLNDRLYEAQKEKVQLAQNQKKQQNKQGQALAHKGARNAYYTMPEMQKEIIDNYTYIPSSQNIIPKKKGKGQNDTYTYIPSQNSTIKSNKTNSSIIRTYIPSQAGANIKKTWDNSGLQSALDRAQRAENRALKILSGNFEGI